MEWIKNIVNGLIEYYETRNILELIDLLDVKIIYKKFNNPDIKARLIKTYQEDFYIYLSDELSAPEERIILAHELGHVVLHDISSAYYNTSLINKGKLEVQANYFASLILLDESDFEKCYLENMSLDQLSSYFEVPKELIEFRLEK